MPRTNTHSHARRAKKIEDAFLAARKYEATPSKREYDESRRKLLEDCLQEAEAAVRKIENMIEQK